MILFELLVSIYGIINQESKSPIYRALLPPDRFFKIFPNTTSGIDIFLSLDSKINYMGTERIKFIKSSLPYIGDKKPSFEEA